MDEIGEMITDIPTMEGMTRYSTTYIITPRAIDEIMGLQISEVVQSSEASE